MIPNINNETGVRMGVIACHSLDPDLEQELWYGSQATDVSYQEAYADAKRDAESEFDALMEEAEIAASEVDAGMTDSEREHFIDTWFKDRGEYIDREDYVDVKLERFSDMCQIDEPEIEGEYEGVTYRIGWLGGAPLLWVVEGPCALANQLCSPCVPNAADLDGGFVLEGEGSIEGSYMCYGVPRNWLRKEQP